MRVTRCHATLPSSVTRAMSERQSADLREQVNKATYLQLKRVAEAALLTLLHTPPRTYFNTQGAWANTRCIRAVPVQIITILAISFADNFVQIFSNKNE